MDKNSPALVEYLRLAHQIMVFTGAGISTASGIPDFRGPQGVWTRQKPVYYQDFMASEDARIEHWGNKLEGWPAMVAARPNAVHRAIVKLEEAEKIGSVVTQNIDGLHSLAGTRPDLLVELHGTNLLVECQSCHWRGDPEPQLDYFREHGKSPLCAACGGFLKMATISFGHGLAPSSLDRASDAAGKADLVIALGSTLSVHPAASFPLMGARRGIPYVIINRGVTDHDDEAVVSLRLDGDVGEIFSRTVDLSLA
jgi:NAD-dependent deacetylase